MARARNIKPGFFANDVLAQCAPGARLCFVGLWTLADRAGRLEDRPIRIKGQLFPYENCDVDGWLNELALHGFITRYEVDGCKYIQVTNFLKHQTPHVREPASTIPDQCAPGASHRLGGNRRISGKGNQESGKGILNSRTRAEPDWFPEWYQVYPRHEARADAAKAFDTAIAVIASKKNISEEESLEWLMGVTAAFAASDKGKSGRFCPLPASWLRDHRFFDDQKHWSDTNGSADRNGRRTAGGSQSTNRVGPGQRYQPPPSSE